MVIFRLWSGRRCDNTPDPVLCGILFPHIGTHCSFSPLPIICSVRCLLSSFCVSGPGAGGAAENVGRVPVPVLCSVVQCHCCDVSKAPGQNFPLHPGMDIVESGLDIQSAKQ